MKPRHPKACIACGETKPPAEFHDTELCRVCRRARNRMLAELSRQWIAAYARRARQALGDVAVQANAFIETRRGIENAAVIENMALEIGGYSATGTFVDVHGNSAPPLMPYRLKHEAILAYGGYRCACPGCTETDPMFLTIDHVNDDGHVQRRQGLTGLTLFRWLQKNNYPPGYRVLCFNCNLGRYRNGGICPHVCESIVRRTAQTYGSEPADSARGSDQPSSKAARPATVTAVPSAARAVRRSRRKRTAKPRANSG
jgi:hypothetical protein